MFSGKWEVVRMVNGRPWSRLQVGWYVVAEARDFGQNGEYAADYWTSRVEAGRYPLYAFRDCGQLWHSLGVSMPGVVVSGSWWNKMEAGRPTSVHVDIYPHVVAKAIATAQADGYGLGKVELLEGVTAGRVEFDGINGERLHTWKLFIDGEELGNAKAAA